MPIRITGLNSGLDTESIISALVSSYSYKTDKYKKAQTKLSWKQDAWKELNTKIYSFYKKAGDLKFSSAYNMHTASVSDSTKAKVSAGGSVVNGVQSLRIKSVARSEYITGGVMKKAGTGGKVSGESTLADMGYAGGKGSIQVTNKETGKTSEINVSANMTIDDFVKQMNSAGIKANFDSSNQRIYLSSASTGEANGFTMKAQDTNADDALFALGLSMDSTTYASTNYNTNTSRTAAADAEITLNGADYKSSTNDFTVNGLSITALAVTGKDEELTVTVDTDSEGLYDKVKDFITSYNSLINEMTSLYNAATAKGYEPLTSEEKEQMTDDEVEKWEGKIKSSILRRDGTLDSMMSAMTTSMTKSYSVNGKSFNLSTLGISTLGYLNAGKNEYSAYHIDGDEDDSSTSGKSDKLMTAIRNDPDSVVSFMKQLTTGLYSSMDTMMKSTTLSSAYTVYNDKEMASEYSDYTDTIKKWEEKLKTMEDSYYKKFSVMESALAKLQSQTNSLSSLFGS